MNFRSIVRTAALAFAAATAALVLSSSQAAQAATAAGTTISNAATATYTDSNGVQYSTQSNTITVEVQNAPSLTVTTNNGALAGTNSGVPNSCFTDPYTLTNAGNGLGFFQVVSAPSFGGNDSASATLTNFSVSVNGGPVTNYATLAAMNTALATAGDKVTSGQTVVITINYCNSNPANVPGLITTTLVANVTQNAADQANPGGLVNATSANQQNTYNDSIIAEARLDLQKSAVVSGTSSAPVVTYTVLGNDGGGAPARMLATLNSGGFGFPSAGVLIADKIPTFNATVLTLNGTPSVTTSAANGFPATATATVYYTTDATGATGWTAVKPATPLWVGVFIAGGTVALNSHAGSSAGNVPAAAVTLTFAVNGPTGAGSGNACVALVGPVTNIANGVIGGNAQPPAVTTPPQIIGPTINTLVSDDGSAAAQTAIRNAIQNTTSLQGPSGASQGTCSSMPANYAVLNGPRGAPGATGSYDGAVAVSNNNDFTDVGFTQSAAFNIINSGTVAGAPNGNNFTAVIGGINASNSVQNSGNINDSYNIVATAPALAGWTVILLVDNAGVPGGALGGATAGATSTASGVAVASGATLNYWAQYSAPNGTKTLTRYDANIVATSIGNGAINNTTHNELYSGFIALTKSVVIVTNCAGAVPANGVCPGGTMTYTVDYRSIVTFPGAANTEPAAAILVGAAGALVVTEDGNAAPNNWATFTNGLSGAATDTTAGTVFTYTPGPGPVAATKFTAQVGGAAFVLQPAGAGGCLNTNSCSGQIAFSVTVK